MAKYIKSFFNTAERRKSYRFDESEEDKTNVAPALDGRRKLSISRSGRMRQANRKRHSLSLEVYNQEIPMTEKPKNTEVQINQRQIITANKKTEKMQRSHSADIPSPDDEIDSAFEIINKTLTTDIL